MVKGRTFHHCDEVSMMVKLLLRWSAAHMIRFNTTVSSFALAHNSNTRRNRPSQDCSLSSFILLSLKRKEKYKQQQKQQQQNVDDDDRNNITINRLADG
jgi:hypothetical protein